MADPDLEDGGASEKSGLSPFTCVAIPDGTILGPSQSFGVYPALSMRAAYAPPSRRWPMILNAVVEKLKRRAKDDFKGRHYEATLIL